MDNILEEVSIGRLRRSFTKEFKVEAVRLLIEGGGSVAQIARDLGIRDTMLGRWKQELAQSPTGASRVTGKDVPTRRSCANCDERMPGCGWNETS